MSWGPKQRRAKAREWVEFLVSRLDPQAPVRLGPELDPGDADGTTQIVEDRGFRGFEIRWRKGLSRRELADVIEHEYAHVLSAPVDHLFLGDHHPAFDAIRGRVFRVFRSVE